MSDEQDPKTGLDPQPTGTVHVWDEGKRYRLRQPRFREYRKLADAWREFSDSLEANAQENEAWLREQQRISDEREARGEPRLTEEDRAEDARRGDEARQLVERGVVSWWRLMFDTLAENGWPYDEDEDAPVFMYQIGSVTVLLGHWRSVPSLSGVR